MISWADNAEDVVLARALPAGFGTYVDVGAGDPDEGSPTRVLAERGWYGINVAAGPAAAAAHRRRRPADVTLELPAAASAERPLDTVLEEFGKGPLDLLRIGSAAPADAVLAGSDLARWRPRVVLVEGADPRTGEAVPGGDGRAVLAAAGYVEALFDGVNHFLARPDDADLLARLRLPASPADGYRHWTAVRRDEEIARLGERIGALEHLLEERSGTAPGAAGLVVHRTLHVPPPPTGLGPRPARTAPASPPPPAAPRVALVGSPGAGSEWLRPALAAALDAEAVAATHPGDVAWGRLPERVVLDLPWRRSRLLERTLADHRLAPVSLARRPGEVVAGLDPPAGVPAGGDGWLAWATGPDVAGLLAWTVEWWATPATVRVRWDDVVADPAGALAAVLDACGLAAARAPGAVVAELGPPPAGNPPLAPDVAAAVDAAHREVAARLGHEPPGAR